MLDLEPIKARHDAYYKCKISVGGYLNTLRFDIPALVAEVERLRVAKLDEPAADLTEDARVFGSDVWVYCRQHCKPHQTGWCGVGVRDKIALGVDNARDALAKCRDWGFYLHGETQS